VIPNDTTGNACRRLKTMEFSFKFLVIKRERMPALFQNFEYGSMRNSRLNWLVAFFGVLFLFQPGLRGQTFKPESYKENSKTAGIQEAIDAAGKAGGGTVQIPAGTFILHAAPGHPPILLRSRVTLAGAGPEKTILKLEANPKVYPSVMANQNWANPDAAEADHDITLQGFTIDVAASDQVLRETKLTRAVPVAGEQETALESGEGVALDSVLRVDPGPNEEIVPVIKAAAGSYHAFLMRPHPAGAKVVLLVERLHGLALAGAHNVAIQNVTIQNAPMDGIYLSNNVDGTAHHTYSQKINIQHCNFIACHRNGISVIDADDVTIANNNFRDITGDPGSPVDVEPDLPEQHGNRIAIRDNDVFRCYRGISLSLQFSGPASENFRGESVTGNKIVGTLYGWGIYVLLQRAGATLSRNTIEGPAAEGVLVVGSSNIQVTNNVIADPGRCHTTGNCAIPASGAGIRMLDYISGPRSVIGSGNTVAGNTIKDTQEPPSLLYGVDFATQGKGNTIEKNVVSRFDPARGMAVHVSGKVESNKISGNSKQ
jgi:parallel beta helix pectate lyase-like protein